MCLGLPGLLTTVGDDRGTRVGTVDFGGATRQVCLMCTPDARVGDYVVVHAGFAISILDEREAAESLALFATLDLTESTQDSP